MPESGQRDPDRRKRKISVTDRNIHRFLGREKYTYQMANPAPETGIVRGLAWTSVGGDTLQIEVNVMPGSGELLLTGQMGDVMKESAQAGISYIRSISRNYGIADDFLRSMTCTYIFRRARSRKTDLPPESPWPRRSCPQSQRQKSVRIWP